ncbi:hypothetical protein BGZ96_009157 [Linnemannia gamsii]|uniref:MULE transposase domain-containing protein n=1 Tax=Linnemannia gamsii TaxID=64522 RepID=A0ABQ7JWU5_9FUNG|nr:hypothetical protein BGZ96_009157 [Linnemannia gamsii]
MDPDPLLSAVKWMEKFESDKGFTYDKNDKPSGLYVGLCFLVATTTAQDAWKNHMHKTNLFTCDLKNADTGKLKDLFSTDDKEYNYTPNAVVTDQTDAQILDIKTTLLGVPVFYCTWHVLRVWEREFKSRMTGLGSYPVKRGEEIRAQFRSQLRQVLYERNKAMAQELIKAFCETWSDQKELLVYLNKNYFGRSMFEVHEGQVKGTHESWILCYRQDISYASINTNNYIEY